MGSPVDGNSLARADEPARVQALVRRFGWNATSFQVLEPGYRYFFHGGDACVVYVDTGRAWVAAGAPLADDGHIAAVAAAFLDAARAAGRRACFFGTEERFTAAVALRHLLIGKQAVWAPELWAETVRGSRNLREQLRRARAKGVVVRRAAGAEPPPVGPPAEAAIRELVARWHRARELAPMGFLARVAPLPAHPDNVLYVAEQEGRLVGLLSVAPIFGRRGWLLQNVLRAPEAPNGTAETLVDQAMQDAAASGQTLVTLGLAPLAGPVPLPLRLARKVGAGLYNFEGLHAFKAKLQPARWDPIFLSFPSRNGAIRTFVDVLEAFARGRLLTFGLRTLLRGPAVVVTLLAVLLVPWTVLLAAMADAGRWFPSPLVKWAWVAFDALLVAGLFALRARWRDGLARALTVAIGCDAVITAFEALSWNRARSAGLGDSLILFAATAAPAIAFLILARATARRGQT